MLDLIFKTPLRRNYFFGYYDKSPLDLNSQKLLALEVNFINRLPIDGDIASIGYFDLKDKSPEFIKLSETKTFNFQQGCMVQWLGPEFDREIIYNDIENNKFVSIILDIETKERKVFPFPVYSVSKDGDYALCIDFERHFYCRPGYNYQGIENPVKNKSIVDNDGIWKLNLKNKKIENIIDLAFLIENYFISNMVNATHYLEHMMINPSGTRFAFLHRWQMEEGGIYDRIFTADLDGNNLYLLNDSGRVGHYCWKNDDEILMYGGLLNSINTLRKNKNLLKYLFKPLLPIYHKFIQDTSRISKVLTGDSYLILSDKTNIKLKVANEISAEDGHPSFISNNSNIFITDTYPRNQNNNTATLISYDLSLNKKVLLAELNSIPECDETGWRCDLHPKCSLNGKNIIIDTMDSGSRGIYVYKISQL